MNSTKRLHRTGNLRLTCQRPTGEFPSVLYVSGQGYWKLTLGGQEYQVTYFWLSDGPVYATTSPGVDFGGDLPPTFASDRNFISDPIWDTGLKDPRFYGEKELSETGWVKFVWVDACYSHLPPAYWEESMCDMGRAFGMMSNDNRYDQDQSYIGFNTLTPNGFENQWVSSVYTWLFWYWLSYPGGTEPYFPVGTDIGAQSKASWKVTEWCTHPGIRWWAMMVQYMVNANEISEPALAAKLKWHPAQ